jgi:hypothetical protein
MSDKHMNDKELEAVLREWTQQAPTGQLDRSRVVGTVVSRLGSTRRRRHRQWPFSWFRQDGTNTAGDEAPAQQLRPIPATNGHTPTVIGRTQTVLSPAKAITAGALVFALGGVMLISQPFRQQANVPGAETEVVASTWVTGNIQPVDGTCSRGDIASDRGVVRSRYECTQTWTSSDPRLTGDVSRPWNEDSYQTDEGVISVGMDTPYLRNEGGGWACSYGYLVKGAGPSAEVLTGNTYTCFGSGGYEGLSAVLVSEYAEDFSEEFVGLIVSGGLPPVPEAPAAE